MWYFVCDYDEHIIGWIWCANPTLGKKRAQHIHQCRVTLERVSRSMQDAYNRGF